MLILVTGATGFVGRSLVPALARKHEVVAVVRRDVPVPSAQVVAPWDLSQPPPAQLPGKVDAVVHLAQSTRHRDFPAGASDMFAVNVAACQHLLEYAHHGGSGRFCLVSSGSVYEPFAAAPLREDRPLSPSSVLGATKLAAETLSAPFAQLFTVSILRLFCPYGPGQAGRLIPNLIASVGSGAPVTLPMDGQGMRVSPTYVDDVAAVIAAAVEEGWRGVLNVASPEVHSIRAIVEIIAELMGREALFAESPNTFSPTIVPDLTLLRQRWNMSRFRTLRDGLKPTLAIS